MEVVVSISHLSVPVTDTSQVGEARRAAKRVSEQVRFNEEQAGKLAIVVTELATNLAIHAKNGEVLLCPALSRDGRSRVDVLAVDRGPGIADLPRSIDDGFSTAGTAGNGLGAVSRLSDHFDIYSDRASGTVVLARMYAGDGRRIRDTESKLNAAFLCIPKKGEHLCGDTAAVRLTEYDGVFLVADGLGHGIAANEASREAASIFSEETNSTPAELLDSVHRGLRATRGAAVAIAQIDCRAQFVKYSGLGNIASAIIQDGNSRNLISHNGIVGHQAHKIQEFSYPWSGSSMLVMNSDGLQTNWRLTPYPGLTKKDPAIVAAVLYRDFSRGRDDVAVLVIKQNQNA